MNRIHLVVLSSLCGASLCALASVATARADALPTGPTIPSCPLDSLLVSQGNSTFACVAPDHALKLSGCRDGDFLTTSGGQLRCKGISGSSSTKALLPDCSSGQVLQSEGSGSWRCVSPTASLPSCSSGDTLVSEGSSGWKCTAAKK